MASASAAARQAEARAAAAPAAPAPLAIGLLTIGQSPRPDGLARDIAAVLDQGFSVLERGALDGLTAREIAGMLPAADDYRLITLLADGTSVQIGKRHILGLLQAQVEALEAEGAVVTLLMCTGSFGELRHARPLLAPQEALNGVVAGVTGAGVPGVMAPLASQVGQAREKWSRAGREAVVVHASPYESEPLAGIRTAALGARRGGADVLYLDCFGYDTRMRDEAALAFGGPVLLARTLAGRLAAELAVGISPGAVAPGDAEKEG